MTVDLLADIGGTNARITFRTNRVLGPVVLRRTADFPSLEALLRDVIDEERARPNRAALAVAGPVTGDDVHLTNLPWTFSARALRQALGVAELAIENDVAAVAWAISGLDAQEIASLTPEVSVGAGAKLVVAPGTGLGMAALAPTRTGCWAAIPSEGGHAYAAPSPAVSRAIRDTIWADGAVHSWEDLISGVGLPRLYRQLGGAAGASPEQITTRARAGEPVAVATIDAFAVLLGAFAGDVALVLGARGGCYLAGGLIGSIGALFQPARFIEGFRAKERFSGYTAAIPVFMVKQAYPALLGLGALLDSVE